MNICIRKKCNWKQKGVALLIQEKTAVNAERYKWCDKQGMGLLNMSPSRVGCGMVYKTDLMLIMETTWIFVVAFLLPWLLHREFGRSTAGQGLW